MIVMAAAGGGLLLGCRVDDRSDSPPFAPNAFVRIGSDGRVTLVIPQVEMGQGMYTALPMLIAEELEVGLEQIAVEQAPPSEKLYANPVFGTQATGGSTSVRVFSEPLRKAGAAARMMLVAAAAAQVRAAFAGYAAMDEMKFPGELSSWTASRPAADGWRVSTISSSRSALG